MSATSTFGYRLHTVGTRLERMTFRGQRMDVLHGPEVTPIAAVSVGREDHRDVVSAAGADQPVQVVDHLPRGGDSYGAS